MDGQAVEDVSCRNVHGSASYLPSVWRPAVVTTCRRPGARAAACASPPPPKPNSPQHLLFFFSCSPHSSAHTLTAALRLRNPSNHALLGGDKGSTEGSVQHHTREPLAATISQLGLFSRYQQRLSPTSTPCLSRPFLAVGPTRLQRWARLKEGVRATTCPTGY